MLKVLVAIILNAMKTLQTVLVRGGIFGLITLGLLTSTATIALAAQGGGSDGGQAGGNNRGNPSPTDPPMTVQEQDHNTSYRQGTSSQAQWGAASTTAPKPQVQNQVRVESGAALQEFVRTRVQERVEQPAASSTQARARIAVEAFIAAQNMFGAQGQRMSAVAAEMTQAEEHMRQREEALAKRSWLRTMLFGQNQVTVSELRELANQNQNRIQEMSQLLNECSDCDAEAKRVLAEQVRLLEQERERIQQVALDAAERRGLFNFLFGWLR